MIVHAFNSRHKFVASKTVTESGNSGLLNLKDVVTASAIRLQLDVTAGASTPTVTRSVATGASTVVTVTADGGTFKITVAGTETSALAYNASAATVKTAVETALGEGTALTVAVTKSGTSYTITLSGTGAAATTWAVDGSSLTGSPTLDVTLEDTLDGTNWNTVGTFTQKTGVGRQVINVSAPYTGDLRVKWVVGGNASSFTFSVVGFLSFA